MKQLNNITIISLRRFGDRGHTFQINEEHLMIFTFRRKGWLTVVMTDQ